VQIAPGGEVRCASCVDQRAANAEPVPWELRSEIGLVQGFWQTLRNSMLRPHEFFLGVRPEQGFAEPLKFLLVCGMINLVGSLIAMVGQFTSGSFMQNFEQAGGANMLTPMLDKLGLELWMLGVIYFVGILILGPFILVLQAFLNAGLIHLAAKAVSADSAGFRGTFHVYAYAHGVMVATGLISALMGIIGGWHLILYTVVSVLGGFASLIVALYLYVLMVFGIRDVHKVSTGRAAGAIGVFFGGLLLLTMALAALFFVIIFGTAFAVFTG
jgi:hypothetical protein